MDAAASTWWHCPCGGVDQAQATAIALGESEHAEETATQRSVCSEPSRHKGVPAQGESGPTVELQNEGAMFRYLKS